MLVIGKTSHQNLDAATSTLLARMRLRYFNICTHFRNKDRENVKKLKAGTSVNIQCSIETSEIRWEGALEGSIRTYFSG